MKIRLKYGCTEMFLDDSKAVHKKILLPHDAGKRADENAAIAEALLNPVSSLPLYRLAEKKENAVIITSDATRPFPTGRVLPMIVRELQRGGIKKENMLVLFAVGSHRLMSEKEMRDAAGMPIACDCSRQDRMAYVGMTSRGTCAEVDERVRDADLVVCLGNVEFHYFAGFSGGVKAIVPGCSSLRTIAMNHRLMTHEKAAAGILEGNPVREDLEEAASFRKDIFLFNAVLSTDGTIAACFAGDVRKAHRMACRYLEKMYACRLKKKADVVIVSAGGFPKDRNLYQAQKALVNAAHAVRDRGTVILAAECREGFGNETFARWMKAYQDPQMILDRIHERFVLGAHKAAAIASVRLKAELVLVSDFPEAEGTMFMLCRSLQKAFDDALLKYGMDASFLIMPFGGSTFPMVSCQNDKKE